MNLLKFFHITKDLFYVKLPWHWLKKRVIINFYAYFYFDKIASSFCFLQWPRLWKALKIEISVATAYNMEKMTCYLWTSISSIFVITGTNWEEL